MSQYFLSLSFWLLGIVIGVGSLIYPASVSASITKGSEKSLLIVRGLTRENAHNQSLLNMVQKLHPHWQVLSFDIPGNGSLNQIDSYLTIEENTDFLRAKWLEQKNKHGHFVVLGISLGGMIVLDWLKRYPQDFDQFAVANSSQSNFCSLLERVKPSNIGYLLKVALPFSNETKERAIRDMTINLVHGHELIKHWVEIRNNRPVKLINVLKQMVAGLRFEFTVKETLSKLKVISSFKDNMVSNLCSQRLAENFKSELLVHPKAGHDICNDDPAWVLEKINKMFTERS